MGRIVTPKYKVEVEHAGGRVASTASAWNSKQSGRANAANLELWVEAYHESLKGCNAHLVEAFGDGANLSYARLSNNLTDETIAEWRPYETGAASTNMSLAIAEGTYPPKK